MRAELEASPRAAAFPAEAFDAPSLAGLDARARREIEAAGKLVTLPEGAHVFRVGEPGESFFVVVAGEVALEAVRRGDATASELRRAGPSDAFGQECAIGLPRRADAIVRRAARLAEVPVHVFRRALGRAGEAALAERLERGLRRAATRDLFATIAFTRALPERDVDVLLDVARHASFARGETVHSEGDPARELLFVAEGLVQLHTTSKASSGAAEKIGVRGYVGRGDFFGDEDLLEGTPRRATAVAIGPTWLVAVPERVVRDLARAHPELLPKLRRIGLERREAERAAVANAGSKNNTTAHVFRDLYRMQVARSLLVIDLESCVRCGHCAWACAEAHDDGEARLVRRGDKMIARVEGRGEPLGDAPAKGHESGARQQELLLPNSCQHCENPACMTECPTGAIGKELGEVFIRPELCTGCGACEKACPWENIRMAKRPESVARPGGAGDFGAVAVKCDLCRELDGPACVRACPTDSILRLNPSTELVDVRDLLRGPAARPRATGAATARPSGALWLIGAAIAGAAFAGVAALMRARGAWTAGHGAGLGFGVAAALGMLGLLAYAAPKRGVRWWSKRRATGKRRGLVENPRGSRALATEAGERVTSLVRPHLDAHLALGVLTIGLALAHAPAAWPRGASSSGVALAWLFGATSLLGALTAIAYRLVPKRLARLERASLLPEDFASARRELLDRLYQRASGKSEVVKKLLEARLVPYAMARLGPLALLVSGRSLRDEERRVRGDLDLLLAEAAPAEGATVKNAERLQGLDELVRLVVELRSLPAQRGLLRVLRTLLPLHVVTFGAALAALAVHVVVAIARGAR